MRSLLGKDNPIQEVNDDLEDLMSDEERMAMTDIIVGMDDLSTQVHNSAS